MGDGPLGRDDSAARGRIATDGLEAVSEPGHELLIEPPAVGVAVEHVEGRARGAQADMRGAVERGEVARVAYGAFERFGGEDSILEAFTRREYALGACGLGAALLALMPFLLHLFGTPWRPGKRVGGGLQGAWRSWFPGVS